MRRTSGHLKFLGLSWQAAIMSTLEGETREVQPQRAIRQRRRSEDHASTRAHERRIGQSESASHGTVSDHRRPVQNWNLVGFLANILLMPLRFLTGFNGNIDVQAAVDYFLADFVARSNKAQQNGNQNISSNSIERRDSNHDDSEQTKLVFSELPYREALAEASRNEKLLLVYLHSSQHPNTDEFCSRIITEPRVAELINEHLVAWGGCIEFAEAYRLSTLLNAATYPYVAILEPPSDPSSTNAKLVERIEGIAEMPMLYDKINNTVEKFGRVVAGRASQRMEAQERQRLRDEQDEALRLSLEEDRRREEERRHAEEEARRAEKEAREAERLAQEQAMRAEAKKAETIASKRASVPEEPSSGPLTTIRFQLPNGSKLNRRFPTDTTMQVLRNYVDCELHNMDIPIVNYSVSLNYPKKTFGPDDDLSKTLEDNGLVPQAVLYVQNLDA